MSLKKNNNTYFVSKEYAVKQLLPHMAYKSGWQRSRIHWATIPVFAGPFPAAVPIFTSPSSSI